jgi:3-hydroxyacyl-CoA dehydrogenase
MKLVEIIRSKYTAEHTFNRALEICGRYGKEAVLAKKDVWYFLASRSRSGISFEANLMYLQEKAGVTEIDACLRYRLGLPMGEFELMDLTGAVDIRSKGMRSAEAILKLYPEFEPWPALMSVHRYIVDKLWAPMSKKGLSGVKTGKGFYTYDGAKPRVPEELCGDMHPLEILAPGLNCAAWCVTNGVGSVDDINKIFRFAFNWPKGIFEYINDYGINEVVKILKRKQKEAPDKVKDFYAADPFLLNWDQQSG